jgi:methylphosphotriester-DNA--protein-cysteine methyltransferase
MIRHKNISDTELRRKIHLGAIKIGGNMHLKIYGLLSCSSGKRMKRSNRIFFVSEAEAIENGYRPCGHCMKNEYKNWKNGIV